MGLSKSFASRLLMLKWQPELTWWLRQQQGLRAERACSSWGGLKERQLVSVRGAESINETDIERLNSIRWDTE